MVLTGCGIGQRAMPPADHDKALAARSAQISAGGYAFGDRVAALLSAKATPGTIALVQQVLRATNPRASCRRCASV
jgi:hypothetical protein